MSIGAACTVRFGNTVNRKGPYTDVELRSGDPFVFGAPSRFACHRVVWPVQPGTGDPVLGLRLADVRIKYRICVTGL